MTSNVEIKFVKTHPDAVLPFKAYDVDNCFDLACVDEVTVTAKSSAVVPVGLTLAYITPGYGFALKPRSGLGFKHGIQPHLGEIDNGYRNDLAVKVFNFSDKDYTFSKGDRVAQFKVEKVYNTSVSFTEEIVPADRGYKGLGSSGK